jgi:DNA-binding NtrC family response regulator
MNSLSPGILFVSPNFEDVPRLAQMLSSAHLTLTHARDVRQARELLREGRYRVVLTEATLPDGMWLDLLDVARETAPETPMIVTDPLADGRLWSEVLNLGGYDMLAQPFYAPEVRRVLANACEHAPQAALRVAS